MVKRILIINFCISLFLFLCVRNIKVNAQPNGEIVKAAVFFYDEDNAYNIALKENLINLVNNSDKDIELLFYDGKENQELQNNQLNEALKNDVDIIFMNIVDTNKTDDIVDKVKGYNIPLIFFAREPKSFDAIKSYGKSIFIGTDDCELGFVEADMILNQIKNKKLIDRNHNGKLDYILLRGNKESIESSLRSRCTLEKMKSNLEINELYSGNFNWDRKIVKDYLSPLLLLRLQDIDIIISNNDEMALGAIDALQEFGYNLGDEKKYIPVFGIDGIPEARELIQKGIMEGTVIQDSKIMADAIRIIGLNMYQEKNPLEDTDYTFDESGVAIRIPNGGYVLRTEN